MEVTRAQLASILNYLAGFLFIVLGGLVLFFYFTNIGTVLLLMHTLYLAQYTSLLVDVLFWERECVINAPRFSEGSDWVSLLINFLVIKPQANIFVSLYTVIGKIKKPCDRSQSAKTSQQHLLLLLKIALVSSTGYSFFLLKALYTAASCIFYKNPEKVLFSKLSALIKNYDISELRIVCDREIWLNPHNKLISLLSLIKDRNAYITDPLFRAARSYAQEHGLTYKIQENNLVTQTSHGVEKKHLFLIGTLPTNDQINLVRTHDTRHTIITATFFSKEDSFTQAQFAISEKNFKKVTFAYEYSQQQLQQIYATLGIKLYYDPLNCAILNFIDSPSVIVPVDNSFLQKDVNLIKMASMIEHLQEKYRVPIRVTEAILNEIVVNKITEDFFEQINFLD